MYKPNEYLNKTSLSFTPKAPILWPYLAEPDTKYSPKYQVTVVLDKKNKAHKKFMDELNKLNEEVGKDLLKSIKSGRKSYRIKEILKPQEDDEGNPTGLYELKVSTKTKPTVIDSKVKPLTDAETSKVGNDSQCIVKISWKCSVATNQKTVGLVGYLALGKCVQVIDLVEYTGGDGGFGEAEGGFESSDAPADDDTFEGDF